jgi:hypothetical protein
MRLTIEGPTGTILECGGLNVLCPSNDGERALAFGVLTRALAMLSGITQQESSGATEAETDAHCVATAQCLDGHTSGVVVLLSTRRERRDEHSNLE